MLEVKDKENETAASQPYIPMKSNKYEIVSKMAFLLGIEERGFDDATLKKDIYKQLQQNKHARIIRALCALRTSLERAYKHITEELKLGRGDVFLIEGVPEWAVLSLSNDGIKLPRTKDITEALIFINRTITDRINNCKTVFPDWLKWEYVRELFIMPGGTTASGILEAAKSYYSKMSSFPFKVYINAPIPDGFLLRSDKAFVTQLYSWHSDFFSDYARVQDMSEEYKSNIYDFLSGEDKIDIVVDCENSDPFKLISMLRSLDWDMIQKVSKLILVNDVHASIGWGELAGYTDVPIEHLMTERVKGDKSLVDGTLISKVFVEFYEENVDSFVLLSSDSDYWSLISMLKKANFLVMVEHDKCGPDLKEALTNEGIFYCYLDDFFSGEHTSKMKKDLLVKSISAEISKYDFDLDEILSDVLLRMRYDMSEPERKKFFSEYLRTMKTEVLSDGKVLHSIKNR